MSGDINTSGIYRPRPMVVPSPRAMAAAAASARAAAASGALERKARPRRLMPGLSGKLALCAIALAAIAGYLASPLMTAFAIREAVASGDANYLRDRIDWGSVKVTLKSSMTTYALGTGRDPVTDTADADADAAPKPGLWQRLKEAYGRKVIDGMVESYVTPESLPKLFSYRESYHETVGTAPVEPVATTWSGKIAREWRRLLRAEFLTPTRFAVEVQDRFTAGKSIAGVLELRANGGGLPGWQLVSLEVKGNRPSGNPTRALSGAWRAMRQAALPASAR